MKVNYPERIDLSVGELKIILSEQRTIINRQKIQALYWLKAGYSPSLTDVAERLGAGLFHSKYIFEYATTKASETLSLSHVLKAMIAIQIKGKVSCDCPRLNESNGANATSIFYAG